METGRKFLEKISRDKERCPDSWTEQIFALLAELTDLLCHVDPFVYACACICHRQAPLIQNKKVPPVNPVPTFPHPLQGKQTNPMQTQGGMQIGRDPCKSLLSPLLKARLPPNGTGPFLMKA